MDESWKLRALCRGMDPGVFFGEVDPQEAKRVCSMCPVLWPCREYALELREEWGVWGGMDRTERRQVLALRGLSPRRN